MGPSSDNQKTVNSLIDLGMSVARLNFSHVTDYSEPQAKMDLVRAAPGTNAKMGWTGNPDNLRAVLVDTKGPEIRTGLLPGNADVLEIGLGQEVVVTYQDVVSCTDAADKRLFLNVDYESIATSVQVGGSILLDDGLIELVVQKLDHINKSVITIAKNGGPIKKNKGVNLPGGSLDLPALTPKDKEDLRWAVQSGADFVAASFIRTAANVRNCIAHLERCCDEVAVDQGKRPLRPLLISKIESAEGVENFSEILKASDGIMVARGDLGVEIPFEKVFKAQKSMVNECNAVGKPVIVATQMLDSMIRQPRPTRAEVTDVGSAVLDGADAVMLSGETAAGSYPLEAMKAMTSIVREADDIVDDEEVNSMAEVNRVNREAQFLDGSKDPELDSVAASSVKTATQLDAKLIICLTYTGDIARSLARAGPPVPVVAFCFDEQVARRLQLHRAVYPMLIKQNGHDKNGSGSEVGGDKIRMGMLRQEAVRTVKELGWVKTGEKVVCCDRNRTRIADGFSGDAIKVGTNMKVFTVV
eukprot:CAMPEP_0114335502 /NCGR_PEP_ID=MMETSP0101-20121206/5101_1 /TAXON_ID=38822 ORGANISM="Pteridomonas danica, Strain PT" /NCGR_SAMPLE_ID=MMETSP0101 /ASSEMBLY_ACC=CAM_ASM_000211 /LENGTH=527 /DNA_ID=CAMNT_0001467149 /DNA_START=76 /DNA_END=1659 /DNA_ORIENTATION=-